MSSCSSVPVTPDSSSSLNSFEFLHRRKIGSIRDNPKLFKICQQFEKASKEDADQRETSKDHQKLKSSDSAPCSLNFGSKTRKTSSIPLHELFNQNIKLDSTGKSALDFSRRFSEGETGERKLLTNIKQLRTNWLNNSNDSVISLKTESKKDQIISPSSCLTNCDYIISFKNKLNANEDRNTYSRNHYNKLQFKTSQMTSSNLEDSSEIIKSKDSSRHNSGNSSLESGVHTCSSASEEEISASNSERVSSDAIHKISDQDEKPPPIPRRGLSMPVGDAIHNQDIHSIQKAKSAAFSFPIKAPSPQSSLPKNVIKENSVRKAILIYEGLSGGDNKSIRAKKISNYPRHVLKKDQHGSLDHNGKRPSVHRRSSRRNSIRKSRAEPSEKDASKITSVKSQKKENSVVYKCNDDSGVSLSDTGNLSKLSRTETMYQTLCDKSHSSDSNDAYDRLSRMHIVTDRTHKGQPSTCAACKTLPSSCFRYGTENSDDSVLHVKCTEMSPHHHPPCICFICQHATFSCAQGTLSNELPLDATFPGDEDSLYYNVCCLNRSDCDTWRQSRRRPVCEQNGKLCVVNCDMENKLTSTNCDFYERLSEWHSTPLRNGKARPEVAGTLSVCKHLSGDSCDSDEGWVDITDSEDEKVQDYFVNKINGEHCLKTQQENSVSVEENQTSSDISQETEKQNGLYSKVYIDNIYRSTSCEHLYETIPEIESGTNNVTNSHYSSNENSVFTKNEIPNDNELDSGEWSSESSSITLGDSSNHNSFEGKKIRELGSSMQTRFSQNCDYGCQDNRSKKTFIKSVLGKKPVTTKKRRMSNFFVPWLASNQEYSISRSPKSTLKKQMPSKPSRTFTKSKRSNSTPSCVSGASLSCTKAVFSSTEILDRCKSDNDELEQINDKCSDGNQSFSTSSICEASSRGSLASSNYLSPEQLQTVPIIKPRQLRSSVSEDAILEVSVERMYRRSSSGESSHTYILFQPIKEENVPLYQFYERSIKERVSLCRSPDSMSPIMWSSGGSSMNHECCYKSPLKSQLSVVEQLTPDAKDAKMLWCELPEVKESGILEQISAQELKLQEAAFDFIQSQASYIRSLKVLYENFIQAPEFSSSHSSFCILSKHEHDVLFSDIVGIKEVSERLMAELTARWSDGILIPDICDIIYRHATMPSFSVYIKYCSNRVYQEKTLKELKETRMCFLEILRKLESNPACQGLSLESFLFLPMQHIARLPLLLDNIFRWLGPDSPSFNICKITLEAVHKVFMECNEGARKMERLGEMFVLNKQLEFKECKAIPLISASRWLLKKGELVKLEFDKKTFGRSNRCIRIPLYMFLFNDLLIITKRKSEDSYMVIDYCQRDRVQAVALDVKDLQQSVVVPNSCQYLIGLTLFSNHQDSTVDMLLNCALLSERTRWLEAIHPVPEKKSEVWEYDHPQVQCVRSYIAQQPDELSLQESDVVTISRKMNDGWYEGKRLRDGSQGWFPASYTMDIPCSRARASNLRQCYRLLMLSQKHETKFS